MSTTKTICCTSHCGTCGRHFHSLEAFDMHHERDATGWPRCLDPLDLKDRDGKDRLVALTEHGECRMYEETEYDVTVWTGAESLERARRVFRNAPETPGEAA